MLALPASVRVYLASEPVDPCLGIAPPDIDDAKELQWLYPDELLRLLSCARVPLDARRLYALAIYLFVRAGELKALDWSDVDIERGIVSVRVAWDRDTGDVVEVRVGGAGIRSQFRAMDESTRGLRLHAVTSDRVAPDLVETPTGAGEIFSGSLQPTELLNDFASSVPQGKLDWSKLMYMLPMGKLSQAGVVEPRYVVSYSELHDGMASRRKYIGYSLRDGSAIDLSEIADPNATGDQRSH